MVALGALHPHAEKDLRRVLRPVQRVVGDAVEVGRAFSKRAPLGGDDLANELVHRLVIAERRPQPVVEAPHALFAQLVAVDAQQIAPLQCPEIDKLRPVEHTLDCFLPFVRPLVGEEHLDIRRRRQRADYVEMNAAKELFIGTQRRRH